VDFARDARTVNNARLCGPGQKRATTTPAPPGRRPLEKLTTQLHTPTEDTSTSHHRLHQRVRPPSQSRPITARILSPRLLPGLHVNAVGSCEANRSRPRRSIWDFARQANIPSHPAYRPAGSGEGSAAPCSCVRTDPENSSPTATPHRGSAPKVPRGLIASYCHQARPGSQSPATRQAPSPAARTSPASNDVSTSTRRSTSTVTTTPSPPVSARQYHPDDPVDRSLPPAARPAEHEHRPITQPTRP